MIVLLFAASLATAGDPPSPVGASVGIRKVKLTGGEPLVRDDIAEIVSRLSPLVKEVSLTTNGSRLTSLAAVLKKSGLSRVNVSLHTLDRETYRRLCGSDEIEEASEGASRPQSQPG